MEDTKRYPNQKKDSTKPILIIIIIILLGVIGYLLYNNTQKDSRLEAQDQKMEMDSVSISAKVKELE